MAKLVVPPSHAAHLYHVFSFWSQTSAHFLLISLSLFLVDFWDHQRQSSSFISDAILGFLSICQIHSPITWSSNSWGVSFISVPFIQPLIGHCSSILVSDDSFLSLCHISHNTWPPWHLDSWSLIFFMLYQCLYDFNLEPRGCREIWHSFMSASESLITCFTSWWRPLLERWCCSSSSLFLCLNIGLS